jgi:hypothetical protein
LRWCQIDLRQAKTLSGPLWLEQFGMSEVLRANQR